MEPQEADGTKENLKKFDENPYNPDKVKPEDVIRIFFINDIPLIPVISNRGILLGVLNKDDAVSELSDIERVNKQKTDQFINKLIKKMSFDELLPYVAENNEFVTINLFGEVQGKWSRLELLAASDKDKQKKSVEREIEKQKEDQVLEWMIYLILEHIPRALFAINNRGKTIFYNSYFEDMFKSKTGREIDIETVEASLNNTDKNELFYRKEDDSEVFFYNKDMKFYYEKIPFKSKEKVVGFLIYCDRVLNGSPGFSLPGIDIKGLSLSQILDSVERLLIVDKIKEHEYNLSMVAKTLKIAKKSLMRKIDKYGIKIDKK
jgi:transcriptional regulator with PAS, ATPase and Fis domain